MKIKGVCFLFYFYSCLTPYTKASEFNSSFDRQDVDAGVTEVSFATEISRHKIKIVLEKPRIFIGDSSVSGGNVSDGGKAEKETYSFSFDGLFVRIQEEEICINDKIIVLRESPKTIWISDNLKEIKVNGNKVEMLQMQNNYKNIDMEHYSVDNLPGGYKIVTEGGIMPTSTGMSFGGTSFIFDRNGIIIKVWGDELFVWGEKLGKIANIANGDKKIILNFKALIERRK